MRKGVQKRQQPLCQHQRRSRCNDFLRTIFFKHRPHKIFQLQAVSGKPHLILGNKRTCRTYPRFVRYSGRLIAVITVGSAEHQRHRSQTFAAFNLKTRLPFFAVSQLQNLNVVADNFQSLSVIRRTSTGIAGEFSIMLATLTAASKTSPGETLYAPEANQREVSAHGRLPFRFSHPALGNADRHDFDFAVKVFGNLINVGPRRRFNRDNSAPENHRTVLLAGKRINPSGLAPVSISPPIPFR